jgi:hypothetical protein
VKRPRLHEDDGAGVCDLRLHGGFAATVSGLSDLWNVPDSARTPEPPARPRLRITDATVEEIGAILAGNPRGLLQTRDELAGWLGSMDRYGGNGAHRAFYLECWNGGSSLNRAGIGGGSYS